MKQMTIFDFLSADPCADCVFWNGKCIHDQDDTYFCESGSFRVTHQQALCPDCGKPMRINQSPFGSDGGYCTNGGVGKVFNNQGNRIGWLEAWKKGMVEAT